MLDPFNTSRVNTIGSESGFSDAYAADQELGSAMVNMAVGAKGNMVAAKNAAEEYKRRQKAAESSNIAGGVIGAISTGLKFIPGLCERRFKQQIRPLDDRSAWEVVRDLPIYQFEYRHRPGVTVYGPMVDEVEAIDPLLVRSMDAEAQAMGIADGKPVRGVDLGRQQAYETLALQQALRRVESLEARVLELEARLIGATSAPADRCQPCWGGIEDEVTVFGVNREAPVVFGGPA